MSFTGEFEKPVTFRCKNYFSDGNILRIEDSNITPQWVDIKKPSGAQNRVDQFYEYFPLDSSISARDDVEAYEWKLSRGELDIVVSRGKRGPALHRRLIGPRNAVGELWAAQRMLDAALPYNSTGLMDIVIGAIQDIEKVNTDYPFSIPMNGMLYDSTLLDVTGITKNISESQFAKPPMLGIFPWWGVYADAEWPVFFITQGARSRLVNIFYYVGAIINDYTHVLQYRLTGNHKVLWSKRSEAQALNNQLIVWRYLIHKGYFNDCTMEEWKLLYENISYASKNLKQNLQGKKGHLYVRSYGRVPETSLLQIDRINSFTRPIPTDFRD